MNKKKVFWFFTIVTIIASAIVAYMIYKRKTSENFEDFENCFDDEDFEDFEEDFEEAVFEE